MPINTSDSCYDAWQSSQFDNRYGPWENASYFIFKTTITGG